MASPQLEAFVHEAFTKDEWTILNGFPEFVAAMEAADSIETADVAIERGSEILLDLREHTLVDSEIDFNLL